GPGCGGARAGHRGPPRARPLAGGGGGAPPRPSPGAGGAARFPPPPPRRGGGGGGGGCASARPDRSSGAPPSPSGPGLAMRLLALLAALAVVPAAAQPVFSGGAEFQPLPVGARNGVSNLHAEGGRLYAGPHLVVTDDGATFDFLAADSAFASSAPGQVSVYSLDVEGDVVWVGLGDIDEFAQDTPQAAAGFAVSTDGGASWVYRFPQLDAPLDTTVVYGVSTLRALP